VGIESCANIYVKGQVSRLPHIVQGRSSCSTESLHTNTSPPVIPYSLLSPSAMAPNLRHLFILTRFSSYTVHSFAVPSSIADIIIRRWLSLCDRLSPILQLLPIMRKASNSHVKMATDIHHHTKLTTLISHTRYSAQSITPLC
jgi:hypothetical protein